MLTLDLVRAQARKGALHPRWIDPEKPALLADAEEVLARFAAHIGKSVGELDEAIADLAAQRPDVVLVRGLAKLMWDRVTMTPQELTSASGEVVTPSAVRAAVFAVAGAQWPVRPGGGAGFADRQVVIADAAAALGLTPEMVEQGLYADLGDAQRIAALDALAPEALLASYNLALAQACLLRAREVRVTLGELEPKRARALMRELKFRRLLFRAEAGAEGYRLTLDGPLSLFKQTSRYGLQLALLLPALVRCARWSLEADLNWARGSGKGQALVLRLDESAPLKDVGRDTGTWTSAEEEHFVASFKALGGPWRLGTEARLVDLDGRDVLVPDYTLTHADGREALLELVFAWRRETFMRRLALLAEVGPPNLVIALADKGGLDDEALPEGIAAYRFKGVIQPRRVIALAEAVAVAKGRVKQGRKM